MLAKKSQKKLKEKSFILYGDIIHPGRVKVLAKSPKEAIEKAEDGDFVIYDEQDSCLGFAFDGSDDHISEEGKEGWSKP